MCMLRSKIVPNRFSFTIAFSCGRAKMIKKKNARCGRGVLEGGKKCQFSSNYGLLYGYFIFKQMEKKRCNKKLEVAAVFYILCIFGGENLTLN